MPYRKELYYGFCWRNYKKSSLRGRNVCKTVIRITNFERKNEERLLWPYFLGKEMKWQRKELEVLKSAWKETKKKTHKGKARKRERRRRHNGRNELAGWGGGGRHGRKKVRNFLKYISLLEEGVNSRTLKWDVIFIYEPRWNIPDRFVAYRLQVHEGIVTPICCIMDLKNDARRDDVMTPFILPDEWGFNLVSCREFQNRHRISRLPSS